MSITQAEKELCSKDFARGANDTGSPEIQCAVFTKHIKNLTEHFKSNPKDFQARKGLLSMVNKRRRLLQYLKNVDEIRYKALIEGLGLRK